jgi:hypothetical protein
MDPVSAIGLAAGILAFVEAGLKLVKTAHDIHTSTDGVSDDNRHRESIAAEVQQAATRLQTEGNYSLTPEQQSLSDLANKCRSISADLVAVINEVKPKAGQSNVFRSLKYSMKANGKEKKIKELESQLKAYNNQLAFGLVELSRLVFFIFKLIHGG